MNAAVELVTPGVAEVLAQCRRAGVRLALDGERLRILPPAGGIEDTLLAALRARKPEIVMALVQAQAAAPQPPPPLRAVKGARLPLAHGQENMWLGEEFAPVADMSNLTVVLELRGPLDVPALQRALTMLSERHAPLRTSLPEDEHGKPFQLVRAPALVLVERAEYSDDALRQAHDRAFDLKHDVPLRALLLERAFEDQVLVLTVHHVASDGWSVGVLLSEIGPLYDAACVGRVPELPALPLDYGDYTLWQKACEDSPWFTRGLDHWRGRLADPPRTHSLPLDRSRAAAPSFAAARVAAHLDAATLAALEDCAREHDSTLFVVLLSAFGVLVHRFGGDADLLIGTPIANRQRQEFAPLIGLFMNVLVSRLQLRGDETFAELLERMNRRYREDLAYQGIPIERLEQEISRGEGGRASRLVQLAFALQNNELPAVRMHGLECRTEFRLPASSTYDLNVNAWQSTRGLELDFQYATGLFDAARIEGMARAFTTLLAQIARTPTQKVTRLALLTPSEQAALLALGNATAMPYPEDAGFHHLFEATAARQPDKVALRFGGQSLTYREINQRANRLASWLVDERGAVPDQLIGVCLERSPELLVALLAVAKSGAGYLPLDPAFPRVRLGYMAGQCGVRTVLVTEATVAALDLDAGCLVRLDDAGTAARIAASSGVNASPDSRRHSPGNLCYVIYTSGSTGNPKGVMIEHRGFTNFLHAFCREPGIGADDVVLAIATSSFDIHTVELFCTLVAGGTVIMASQSEYSDPSALIRLMDTHGVSVAQATPTTWLGIVDTGWRPSRPLKAFVGGEALQDSLRDRLLAMPHLTLWNLYGPTETTVWCCARRVEHEVLIGTPIANQRFYVLDAEMRPVPLGVEGDLYIAGDGMGRGYIANPELTERAYLKNIPAHLGESCLYRTGDRVSRRAGGELCFHGRRDNQVKVNGFRIETGEIVTALENLPEVRQAAVVVRKRANNANYLAAFVLAERAEQGAEVVASLPARLQKTLPHYMVPAQIVAVTSFPKTPTGKLDLKLLSEQSLEAPSAAPQAREQPATPMQLTLTALWTDLLSLRPDALALDDDVIASGADSIRVMMFVGRARKRGVDVSAADVYGAPTVRALAALVAGRHLEERAAAESYSGPAPLLADQAMALSDDRVWRRFYINFIFDLPAALELPLLQRAFEALVRTQDALRARFQVKEGRAQQHIAAPSAMPMAFAESLGCDWDDAGMPEALRAATDRLHARLSPETGPLLGAAQMIDTQGRCKLLFAVSHLVADGFSMVLLLESLIDAYTALRRGAEPAFSNPLSIDAWAPRYREYVNSDAYCAQLDFWESRPWPRALPLPRDHAAGANVASTSRGYQTQLDASATQAIHADIPRQLGMPPRDLLAAALARVLMRWSGGDAIALHLHDAGRKDLEAALGCDFSRVAGAFSVRHCVFLERTPDDEVIAGIRGLQEQMARTPQGGAGLLPLRAVCEREDIAARARRIPDAEVWFNYLGAVSDTLFSDEAPDAEIPSRLSEVVRHIQVVTHEADTPRGRVFSLTARVSQGCLQFSWDYSAALHREETVRTLAQEFTAELERIAAAART